MNMPSKPSRKRSHESAEHHVSGKAIYTDDQRSPAGMLFLYPVLSPHASAKILKIDPQPAYAIPGVVTVLTETLTTCSITLMSHSALARTASGRLSSICRWRCRTSWM